MKNTELPLVSVIIPTFNRPFFLKETLESVVKQTYENIEIIVVDDGSIGDENERVCRLYPDINYQKINNNGKPSKPRNYGISLAKGDYIAFLDDDDLWLSHKIEYQVGILEKNKEYGLAHSYCEVIDETGNKKNKIIGKPGNPKVKHGDCSKAMIGNWTLMMPTPLLRREIVEKVGLFNEDMPHAGEDVEYWTRCSFETQFYYVDEALALYREHPNNASLFNPNYIKLPFYLKKILNQQINNNRINKKEYHYLLNNLVQSQIKNIRFGIFESLKYLFLLDVFWWFKINNIKLLILKLYVK